MALEQQVKATMVVTPLLAVAAVAVEVLHFLVRFVAVVIVVTVAVLEQKTVFFQATQVIFIMVAVVAVALSEILLLDWEGLAMAVLVE